MHLLSPGSSTICLHCHLVLSPLSPSAVSIVTKCCLHCHQVLSPLSPSAVSIVTKCCLHCHLVLSPLSPSAVSIVTKCCLHCHQVLSPLSPSAVSIEIVVLVVGVWRPGMKSNELVRVLPRQSAGDSPALRGCSSRDLPPGTEEKS